MYIRHELIKEDVKNGILKQILFNAISQGYTREVDLNFEISPGRPAVMYLPNGDPGYPEEPPEVEEFDVTFQYGNICLTIQEDDLTQEFNERLEQAAWDYVAGIGEPDEPETE